MRVAEILMTAPTHMTAEQILAAVREGGERVSKATVYNTLKVLADTGLVRQIHLDDTHVFCRPDQAGEEAAHGSPEPICNRMRVTSLHFSLRAK